MRGVLLRSRIAARVPAPIANEVQFVLPATMAEPIANRFLRGPSLSIENPKILGSWLIRTVSAMPFM
jgi:hypothetical protein